MIYLCAGVFAEGPTDYDFLLRLLNRHLDELGAQLFAGNYEVADTIGIDAPAGAKDRRADKIAAAIDEFAEICTLFVIHSDGGANAERAQETCIDPGIATARNAHPEVVAVPCVPVREIEAWLLTDPDSFRAFLGKSFNPDLPSKPEKEIDPKATLQRILQDGGSHRSPESIYALFGEKVRIETLRSLPAFQAFEAEMIKALEQVARSQGHRI